MKHIVKARSDKVFSGEQLKQILSEMTEEELSLPIYCIGGADADMACDDEDEFPEGIALEESVSKIVLREKEDDFPRRLILSYNYDSICDLN